jgi:hypothetical protein
MIFSGIKASYKPQIMKKILFILAAITLSFGAMAQGNGHGKGKNKQGKKYETREGGRYDDNDDRYERNQRSTSGVYGRNDRNENDNGKYTNNAPRKVRDAFYNDYPNASNVSWTKDRGVWTARFNGGGIFGGGNTVSYRANGQRVGTNNTVYGSTRQRDRNNTQTRSGGTVWDKVIRKP